MINIERVSPPKEVIEILEKEKAKSCGTYNKKEVVNELVKQFYNKCYICGNKDPLSLNIEHLKPHKENKDLKFDWKNLFLSCAHCNNIKLAKYDDILDCTNPKNDIENWIKYYADPYPTPKVEVTALKNDTQVNNTVELINVVYNGTTAQKKIESINLVKQLKKELMSFQKNLWDYNEADNPESKEYFEMKIKQQIHCSSSFTAFKRWIMKDLMLYDDFNDFIHG